MGIPTYIGLPVQQFEADADLPELMPGVAEQDRHSVSAVATLVAACSVECCCRSALGLDGQRAAEAEKLPNNILCYATLLPGRRSAWWA